MAKRRSDHNLNVRLDGRDLEYVDFLAAELGMNRSEVIRELIRRDREEVEARALAGPLRLTPGERRVLKRILSKL
ncbi:MAG: ribbon-helix-helix protein, CopG family [Deltaproteobacteria bacterium]|nr:ribbon-helix-helix protein, CopG family [Deltaproteobacteria bacterium]